MRLKTVFAAIALTVTAQCCINVASAQNFPVKPIRIVTSFPGGGTDFTARVVAQALSGSVGQQVIVDNRGPLIAMEVVAKSPSDGYTLLVAGKGSEVVANSPAEFATKIKEEMARLGKVIKEAGITAD